LETASYHLNLNKMKKVLIALDFDPSAQKVAETGHQLSRAMNAQTILLHVTSEAAYYSYADYSPLMGFDSFNNLVEAATPGELETAAQDFLDKSKLHLGDETIQTVVATGDFAETIIETATELKADIIVLGSHGRRGLERILLGSVGEQVLHRSLIPLFIVPTKTAAKKK